MYLGNQEMTTSRLITCIYKRIADFKLDNLVDYTHLHYIERSIILFIIFYINNFIF